MTNYNLKAAKLNKSRTKICARIGCHSKAVWWKNKAYGLCQSHYSDYKFLKPDQKKLVEDPDEPD